MILSITRRAAAAAAIAAAAGLLTMGTTAGPAGASPAGHSTGASAQHRQIGAAELTWFKVVLTVTKGTGQPPGATLTAAGYQRSGSGWRLISVKRIGAPNQWFWYAVQTCSLDIAQFRAGSPVQNVAALKVSLLATPALGCTKLYSEHWTR
jgi:hypothetical protein